MWLVLYAYNVAICFKHSFSNDNIANDYYCHGLKASKYIL